MPGAAMLEMAFAAASKMVSEMDGNKVGKSMLSNVSIPMAMDIASSKILRCNIVLDGSDSELIIDSLTSTKLAVKHLKASVHTALGMTTLLHSKMFGRMKAYLYDTLAILIVC